MKKVQVFTCPTVNVPKSEQRVGGPRKQRDEHLGGENGKRRKMETPKDESFRSMLSSIKELASSTDKGMKKIQYNSDKLTKLGAAPLKEQTMPLKMKLGIIKGRKVRADKSTALAKESGQVVANVRRQLQSTSSKRKSKASVEKRYLKSVPDIHGRAKDGYMKLNASNLPKKLTGRR